jgi:hypothetical protein
LTFLYLLSIKPPAFHLTIFGLGPLVIMASTISFLKPLNNLSNPTSSHMPSSYSSLTISIIPSAPSSKLCSLCSSVTAAQINSSSCSLMDSSLLQHSSDTYLLLKPNLAQQHHSNHLQGALPCMVVPLLHTSGFHTLQFRSSPLPAAKNDQTGDLTQFSPFMTTPQHRTAPAITHTIRTPSSFTTACIASAHLPISDKDQRCSFASNFSSSPSPTSLTYSPPISTSIAPF